MISFEQIKTNEEINLYIKKADDLLSAIGFTEHSFAHVGKVVDVASYILTTLGYSERTIRRLETNGTYDLYVINLIAETFNIPVVSILFN